MFNSTNFPQGYSALSAAFREIIHIYIYGVVGVWVELLGGGGPECCCLSEFIWNAPAVSLVPPAFENTCSLGSLLQLVYTPGSTLGDYLPFSCREWGGLVKTHHFLLTPTFPCFPVFPLLLTSSNIVLLSAAC